MIYWTKANCRYIMVMCDRMKIPKGLTSCFDNAKMYMESKLSLSLIFSETLPDCSCVIGHWLAGSMHALMRTTKQL